MIAWKTAARMSCSWKLPTCPEWDSCPLEKISVTEGTGSGSQGQRQRLRAVKPVRCWRRRGQVSEQLNAGEKGMGFGKEKHLCLILA